MNTDAAVSSTGGAVDAVPPASVAQPVSADPLEPGYTDVPSTDRAVDMLIPSPDQTRPVLASHSPLTRLWKRMNDLEWTCLSTENAEVWIVTDNAPGDYSYGGTRLVSCNASDTQVLVHLERLALYESALKNRLLNHLIQNRHQRANAGQLAQQTNWPEGFLESRVGGARCLVRPRNAAIEAILSNPDHELFVETISPVLQSIGTVLNEQEGRIKLTPDFGHFVGLSDLLYASTEHTLGISREYGGCGGKTRYSSYGVIAVLEKVGMLENKRVPITLIGSAGAMGVDILHYFLHQEFEDIAVCDLKYEQNPSLLPEGVQYLRAVPGRFTDACLVRGGMIVATTIGQELEHSHWQCIPAGTQLFLAHNLSVPSNTAGKKLMRSLMAQGVYALSGQMLTLGGALTSRLEWFFRQTRTSGEFFDKPAAYKAIKELLQLLVCDIDQLAKERGITPYEAMLAYAEDAM